MDLALLFFLPLLGGYFFVRTFILTRYATAHEEPSKVYYRAALAGCVLALLGALLHASLVTRSATYAALARDAQVNVIAPLFEKGEVGTPQTATDHERREVAAKVRAMVALTCVWAFCLGLGALLCNLLVSAMLGLVHLSSRVIESILRRWGWQPRNPPISPIERLNRRAITDDLERLLYQTMVHGELIQVSLDNNKVYVGIVRSVDPVGAAKHFTMQPLMSGGRDSAAREVKYTSFYDRIIRKVTDSEPIRSKELLRRFQIVIPLSRIVTASGFDMAAYRQFELARSLNKLRYRMDGSGRFILAPKPRAAH